MTAFRITRVARFGLVVGDLDAAERFFVEAFDFVPVGRGPADPAFAALVGLPDSDVAQVLLRLGRQEIVLTAFAPSGRPYPAGSTSSDLWFQHFAIIVSDMDAAYAGLRKARRFSPITGGGPITLPEASGGVSAFKFRDAEGHPLELLSFPKGKAPEAWRGDALFLGLDHSAIAVADTATTRAFLKACLGLDQSMQSENVGPEQARMDDVPDARVTVTGMAPEHAPPHVELLGYHVGTRRPIDGGTRADDIAATFFVLETSTLDPIVEALAAHAARFVSPGIVSLADGRRAIAVLDPDGHRFVVEESTGA